MKLPESPLWILFCMINRRTMNPSLSTIFQSLRMFPCQLWMALLFTWIVGSVASPRDATMKQVDLFETQEMGYHQPIHLDSENEGYGSMAPPKYRESVQLLPERPKLDVNQSDTHVIVDNISSLGTVFVDKMDKNVSIPTVIRPGSIFKPRKRQKCEQVLTRGNPVKEGHVNYRLMYDMLTGIRISVSQCISTPARDVEPVDFLEVQKYTFNETGQQVAPKSEYDYKFKDYAPWVFKTMREMFNIDSSEYLLSLTEKFGMSELGSPGKSGSFLYFSSDDRFIIKTIHRKEHTFMLNTLVQYYNHIKANPHTLLSRILGLHRVKVPGRKKNIYFVVMVNLFPPNKEMHQVYDLKGSTVRRSISDDEIKDDPRAVMQDVNWLGRGEKIRLGSLKRMDFCEQMERDVAYLKEQNIMDYSLLVGIHDMSLGNKGHTSEKSQSVFEPSIVDPQPKTPWASHQKTTRKRQRTTSDPHSLTRSASTLSLEPIPQEKRHVVFYQDAGGFQATDENDQPLPIIYYLGIIDIFTDYSTKKKLEHMAKSIAHNGKRITAIPSQQYGDRFLEFMKNAIQSSS